MFRLRKNLHRLPVLAMVIMLAFSAVPVLAGAAGSSAEPTATLEIVSSYPYTTKTKVKVNLRASRSVRSELLAHIPAGAEITVNSVSKKSGWASIDYGKKSGYEGSQKDHGDADANPGTDAEPGRGCRRIQDPSERRFRS